MKDLKEEIIPIIKKAGEATLSFFGKELDIEIKGDESPVTQADLASNKILVEGLKKYNFGILSEESVDDLSRLEKEYVWIIDPLDGTKEFIDNIDEFVIIVGLVKAGKPILGFVYRPVTDTLYYAEIGKGAFKRAEGKEERLKVSSKKELKNSSMVISRFHQAQSTIDLAKKHDINITNYGGALKKCLIAEGKAEFSFNPSSKTSEWDLCGADIILREAGGKISDIHGNDIIYNKKETNNKNGYIASNEIIHDEVIEELKELV